MIDNRLEVYVMDLRKNYRNYHKLTSIITDLSNFIDYQQKPEDSIYLKIENF